MFWNSGYHYKQYVDGMMDDSVEQEEASDFTYGPFSHNQGKENIKIKAKINFLTKKAYNITRNGNKYWLPRSQIKGVKASIKEDGIAIITIPKWLFSKLTKIK